MPSGGLPIFRVEMPPAWMLPGWRGHPSSGTVRAMDLAPAPNPFTLLVFVLLAAVLGVAIFAFAFTQSFGD